MKVQPLYLAMACAPAALMLALPLSAQKSSTPFSPAIQTQSPQPISAPSKPVGDQPSDWPQRILGEWTFTHQYGDDASGKSQERATIRFGKDGRYAATTVIRSPVEEMRLESSGNYEIKAIDSERAHFTLRHESKDTSISKDRLTETFEIRRKGERELLFPDNAVLHRLR